MGGTTYAQSDQDAAYPISRPVSPADLAATIDHALGISPHLRIPDAQNRPVALVENGKPLTELFG